MKINIKQSIKNILISFAVIIFVVSPLQAASKYPNRPVKFLVPWPPGDLEDVLTRIIAEAMAKETGKPASVINKSGGGGVVGATQVARSRPNGLLIGSLVADLVTTQIHSGNAPYKAEELEPVGIFLDYPLVIAARKDAPYNTIEELAEYSQKNPVSLGHFGYQALPTGITLKAADKLNIKFGSDAPFDSLDCSTLANGDADIITPVVITILPCLKSGDVKLLSSITRNRLAISPETPTLAEKTGVTLTSWNGLFVRKGTPDEIKQLIAKISQRALESDKAKEVAQNTGAGIFWIGGDEAKAVIAKDFDATKELLDYLKQE